MRKSCYKWSLGCLAILWFLGFFSPLQAQKHTISGYVTDAASGEMLISATVFDANSQKGSLTNAYGFFSLTLPAGPVRMVGSYAGFQSISLDFDLQADTSLNVALAEFSLDEVEIVAENQDRAVEQTQMSVVEIPIDQIKKLPVLFGEVDVIKALQLMPGVQSGNEGSAGLYVRGGGPDQNLILLDGVPLYYVSHLGGFFSVFNADALSSVKLYKGGFPARYGGRLSSILDIRMKEGNLNEYEGEGSIGLISSKLSFQGPIQQGKSSFILSARRTYVDLFSRPISRIASGGEAGIGYFFYDLNGKVNTILSDRDRLFGSFYLGDDRFTGNGSSSGENFQDKFSLGLSWGNRLAALRWNHIWSDQLFSNLSATFTRYQLKIGVEGSTEAEVANQTFEETFGLEYRSQIQDWGLKFDFDYYPAPAHEIKFGIQSTLHTFEPSTVGFQNNVNSLSLDTVLISRIDRPLESSVYVEDNFKIGRRISANVGVHAVHYLINQQQNWSVQPRAALRLQFTDKLAFKASYAQMTQFVHLLTNSGVGLPIDLWVPATERVPAQRSWQAAAGLSVSLAEGAWELSLEGYYKEMDGLIGFREGNNFFFGGVESETWETTVETGGEGQAYGGELLVQKKRGKTTGWIGYTLAWNWRQFEQIDQGVRFPYKYDRRHDISIVVSHEFSKKVSLATTWVYGTGNAISLPTAGFASLSDPILSLGGFGTAEEPPYRGSLYSIFSSIAVGRGGVELFENGRNGFRMQPYHRLDIAVNFSKEKKWGERTWSFGLYNAYSRLNPFTYYFEDVDRQIQGPSFEKKLRKLSLFPVIPSIAYLFKF